MGTIRKAFAFNLRIARGTRTQHAMAEALEMPLRTYQRLEGAERFPQEATLEQITAKLGVSEESLFYIAGSKAPPTRSDLLGDLILEIVGLDETELSTLLDYVRLYNEGLRQKKQFLRKDR